ncbi:MAG: ATP-binding protein [Blautia sp.]|nr:ATP-binding protein [Blautia sp.]
MSREKKESIQQSKRIKGAILQKGDELLVENAVITDEQAEKLEQARKQYLQDMTEDERRTETIMNSYAMKIYQAYLPELSRKYAPMIPKAEIKQKREFKTENRVRYFDITKWVTDAKEKNMDKLVNVYQALANQDCNIALIYRRTVMGSKVTIAISNVGESDAPDMADKYAERLRKSLMGNFPGAQIMKTVKGSPVEIGEDKDGDAFYYSVAAVSNLASDKSEDFVSQNIEKLLDGIVPSQKKEEYTLVLLAEPFQKQDAVKADLSEIYSQLSPFMQWQSNASVTESEMLGAGAAVGVNAGASVGVQFIGSLGFNAGVNMSKTLNRMEQVGKSEGMTRTYMNYGVKHLLDTIEKQVERMDECTALGMWKFAAYAISEDADTAEDVAHMYLSLTQGDKSFSAKEAINLWTGGDIETARGTAVILDEIRKLRHPRFCLRHPKVEMIYPIEADLTLSLSGKELAKALNFPSRSVSGLPVLESASFGREVHKFTEGEDSSGKEIEIGNVFHMRRDEESKVKLDVDSLASHVFVTGSTGTGKSNTIYQLISRLHDNKVKYLVVEPAKGEYKNIFGGDCKVYGTNIAKAELLKINPFSFPQEIHVLEHIDRLVEIFNACWPMYAAMPAILKDAIEKSYEKVGWNLGHSRCVPLVFPTFADLIETLPEVMDSSLYSADTKSDYSGALITRVLSLTNGINGQIFCSGRELSDEELFDNNVIIDLSRVGSTETKSLLMGILVMKLQEYRLCSAEMNVPLRHVTVLEEAHNLLRKTSVNQSQEGANLQGKAVEMLTNSIAEMRTYGEGFIIADQAPALLDEAVIRNTNTKIALRLPDDLDRKPVGSSMALSDDQIVELAKLPKGVAAVYQNDWVEAVLCHFEKYEKERPFHYDPRDDSQVLKHFLNRVFGIRDGYEIKDEDADIVRDWINSLRNSLLTKRILLSVLEGKDITDEEREIVAYNVFDGQKLGDVLESEEDADKGVEKVNQRICTYLEIDDDILIDHIRRFAMQAIFKEAESEGRLVQRYRSVEGRGLTY